MVVYRDMPGDVADSAAVYFGMTGAELKCSESVPIGPFGWGAVVRSSRDRQDGRAQARLVHGARRAAAEISLTPPDSISFVDIGEGPRHSYAAIVSVELVYDLFLDVPDRDDGRDNESEILWRADEVLGAFRVGWTASEHYGGKYLAFESLEYDGDSTDVTLFYTTCHRYGLRLLANARTAGHLDEGYDDYRGLLSVAVLIMDAE